MDVKLLKTLLSYDPATGLFIWKASDSTKPIIGTVAGTLHSHGYIRIKIKKKFYYAHRLAWLYVYGKFPEQEIDHKDRDPANNRIDNLRLATHPQNASNAPKRRTNACGLKGVIAHQGRWMARIGHKGKNIYLGVFDTAEEAHAIYVIAAKKYHGEFARY
jgi:HNH endonuclease